MRFEVRHLTNGEGLVIIDTERKYPMIGPYPKTKKGRERALARAAEFEADPTRVPTCPVISPEDEEEMAETSVEGIDWHSGPPPDYDMHMGPDLGQHREPSDG